MKIGKNLKEKCEDEKRILKQEIIRNKNDSQKIRR